MASVQPLVQFTHSAQTDLLEAWLFIAEENLSAADCLLDRIKRETHTLLLQLLMSRARPEMATDVRGWPTLITYVLFYVVVEKDITLLCVLHHARDIRQFGFDQ